MAGYTISAKRQKANQNRNTAGSHADNRKIFKGEQRLSISDFRQQDAQDRPTKQNRIHKILGKVNKNLKLLAADLGVEANITTYVARHSFASVLKKSGVNIALISEALGHSDLATTQIYLDSFDNEQVDDAMKNLL